MKSTIKTFLAAFYSFTIFAGYGQNFQDCSILDIPIDSNIVDVGINNFSTNPSLGMAFTTDRFGDPNGALNFNGINQEVVLNNNNSVITGSVFTISLWAKVNGQGGGALNQNFFFQQRASTTSNPNMISMKHSTSSNLNTVFYANSTAVPAWEFVSTPALPFGDWHHYVMVMTSDSLIGYRDGVKFESTYFPGGGTFNAVDFVTLGSHTYFNQVQGYLNGALDDIKIFDCALTNEEVLGLYNEKHATGIASLENNSQPTIFPNPTSGLVTIHFDEPFTNDRFIQLVSVDGKILKRMQLNQASEYSMDLAEFAAGIYFIQLIDGATYRSLRLIKQ